MSHCIQVFVIKKDEAKIDLAKYPHVEAPQGFIIIPVEEDIMKLGATDISSSINLVLPELSYGISAYLETDYFGGAGEQSARIWDGGIKEMTTPVYGAMNLDPATFSIDKALSLMGVRKELDKDEFDTLGLGGYRSNRDFFPAKEIPVDESEEEPKRKFNVNYYVYIKLTNEGKERWKKYFNEVPALYPPLTDKEIENKKNSDGTWEFQMHEFMDIFHGFEDLYETTIYIKEKDLIF